MKASERMALNAYIQDLRQKLAQKDERVPSGPKPAYREPKELHQRVRQNRLIAHDIKLNQ